MDIPNLKPTKSSEGVFVTAVAIGASLLLLIFSENKDRPQLKSLEKKQESNFWRGK